MSESKRLSRRDAAPRLPVLAWLFLLVALAAPRAAATSYVVFRYDDMAGDKPGLRAVDTVRRQVWEAEVAQDRIFARHGVGYVSAVVPSMAAGIRTNITTLAEDPEKVAFIKESAAAGRMQVALHGFTHWNYSAPHVRRAEFRRADAAQQRADLAAGRQQLIDTLGLREITTFVPPFNGWNAPAGAALEELGFTILSADRQWNIQPASRLKLMPFTAQLWELEEWLNRGPLPDGSVVIILYHPPQILRMQGAEGRYYGLDKLDALVARLVATPGTKVVTLDQLAATGLDFSPERYNTSVNTGRLQALLAQVLPARLLPGWNEVILYLEAADYRRTNLRWVAIVLGVAAVLLAAGWVAAGWVQRRTPVLVSRLLAAGAVLALAACAWAIVEINRRGFHPTAVRFFPVWPAIGWLLGAIRGELRRSRPPAQT